MFRKPFKTKSNTRLKTSDKKKFRNDVIKQFPNAELSPLECLNIKSNIFSLELLTHSNECVTIYGISQYPSFIFANGVYYPTVYLLWECPQLVSCVTTHPAVSEKIQNGADLMSPGVVKPVESNHIPIRKGDCVGINLTNNSSVIAVGEAIMNSEEFYAFGAKGKCVSVIHFFGDYLSELAAGHNIPIISSVAVVDELENKDVDVVGEKPPLLSQIVKNNSTQVLSEALNETNLEDTSSFLSLDTMEDMINFCFFRALLGSVKCVQLPLLTNLFYKNHMMEVYPTGANIDIKKSKYKKLSSFLECMAKDGIIEIESTTSGIHKIININYGHSKVKEFSKNYPAEKKESSTPLVQGPTISENFTINAAVLPLFSKFNFKKGDIISNSDIRRIVVTYVKSENLQDESDKRFVKLDPLLASMLKKDCPTLTWEDIMKIIIDMMGHSYQVSMLSTKTISGKGKIPPIEIQVANRAGNKKVTLINNLTLYGVNLQEFSKECQHGVAASTTINNLPNLKAEQMQVQGSHINFIGKLLTEKYKIPKRYIRGWNM